MSSSVSTESGNGGGRKLTRRIGLVLGPLVGLGFFIYSTTTEITPELNEPIAWRMAAVAALMAVWWITEALPLAATALLPVVLFPVLGVLDPGSTTSQYFNTTIFLFLGGFMIALTMERWNLHKRIALWIIRVVGTGPSRLVLGFMIAAAFLSMWISNTATALMMLPIALAIVARMTETVDAKNSRRFTTALLLGTAYACSIGGIATLVGTPPNLSFRRIFDLTFPGAPEITFGEWLQVGLPIAVVMLVCGWLVLTRLFFRIPRDIAIDRAVIQSESEKLGPIRREEWIVLGVFTLTALLWVFRKDLDLGLFTIPGWSGLFALPDGVNGVPFLADDSTIAVGMALLLFLIPAPPLNGNGVKDDRRILIDPNVFARIPWHIILLFGGGFALAFGFKASGLSQIIGESFAGLAGVPPIVFVLVVCLGLTFLTELTSNTATTEMILPILAAAAVTLELNPLALMLPATFSASCAFMMPVATPPNAIIFGSGHLRIPDMARVGVVLNLIGAVVITLAVYYLAPLVFDFDFNTLPAWATLK